MFILEGRLSISCAKDQLKALLLKYNILQIISTERKSNPTNRRSFKKTSQKSAVLIGRSKNPFRRPTTTYNQFWKTLFEMSNMDQFNLEAVRKFREGSSMLSKIMRFKVTSRATNH